MAKSLLPISISAPGFMGLNLQDSPTNQSNSFALQAENCVIDSYGRIAARKGWTTVNATNATLGSTAITAMEEHISAAGVTTQLSVGNKNVFTGTSTLTSIYNDATWTGTNWKIVTFNNKSYFFQRGHDPLVYDGATLTKITAASGYAGSVTQSNEVLAAYSRLWVADTSTEKATIYYSDTLSGHVWTGGSSGSLDLRTVFKNGMDEIVALAAFNNFLVILCKRQTIIYSGATTPSTMSLYDVIGGVGCIARDSVQDIGTDLIFLSSTGVQSLSRIIQEKSAPINELSVNVRDALQSSLRTETMANIRSVYSPADAFYLLSLPASDTVYCFDTRSKLENGALRTTTWQGQTPTAFTCTRARLLYFGKPGYIGKYTGYLDNSATYTMRYYTNHMNGGEEVAGLFKFLKTLSLTLIGGTSALIRTRWTLDYNKRVNGVASSRAPTAASEFGISEFGIAEYGNGNIVNLITQEPGGEGKVLQLGLEITVNNYAISIQQLDIYFTVGRKA